jgi:murein DD-endopeptidase MepM/ murein hydrolase activator NlpD
MKRFIILVITIGFIFFPGINGLLALSISDIYISSYEIEQGDLALIRIRALENETPTVIWNDKNIHLVQSRDRTDWTGFLAVDLTQEPGLYSGIVRIKDSGWEYWFQIEVSAKDYGVRRLTLPKKMVTPDPEVLERIKQETGKMVALWQPRENSPAWRGPFLRPVPGEVVGTFGRRSVINDQPRAPHSGIDMRGAKGSPVKAINRGMVVLTGDQYYSGRSIVLDHGGEVLSMYFHLDKIKVKTGDIIERGQIIGLVGSTGRVTGPHLHFGVRINGARVDPLKLITISKELEE